MVCSEGARALAPWITKLASSLGCLLKHFPCLLERIPAVIPDIFSRSRRTGAILEFSLACRRAPGMSKEVGTPAPGRACERTALQRKLTAAVEENTSI